MAISYRRVFVTFWAETAGWSADERNVALYLLTCEHSTAEGLYRLPVAYALDDLQWDDRGRYVDAVGGLQARGWLVWDEPWVVVRNALRWNAPESPNHAKGALRRVAGAPRESRAWTAWVDLAREFAPHLAEMLKDEPGGLRDASQVPSRMVALSPVQAAEMPPESSSSNSSSTSTSTSSCRHARAREAEAEVWINMVLGVGQQQQAPWADASQLAATRQGALSVLAAADDTLAAKAMVVVADKARAGLISSGSLAAFVAGVIRREREQSPAVVSAAKGAALMAAFAAREEGVA